MAWFLWVFWAVIGIAAVSALTKVNTGQPPPGIGEIKAPTADSSRDIPVVFGTVDIPSANLVFMGNMTTTPIKVKVG